MFQNHKQFGRKQDKLNKKSRENQLCSGQHEHGDYIVLSLIGKDINAFFFNVCCRMMMMASVVVVCAAHLSTYPKL